MLQSCGWAALMGATAVALAGCGTPGAPQPPSLNLPARVSNLVAVRTGNQVALAWTMPAKNTDGLPLENKVAVRICREESAGTCEPIGNGLSLAPGEEGRFTETLPKALVSGAPRTLTYFVELQNRNGRSAGLSNSAVVLAGAAPAQVTGLTAEQQREGIVLRWTPDNEGALIRLRRTLLSQPKPSPGSSLLKPLPEPVEQNLLVEPGGTPGVALDKDTKLGRAYEYRAQRVVRIAKDGRTLELDGAFSAPVRIEARDIFPPAVPTGLAAVASTREDGTSPAIDLSWQPNGEPDLAGYIVYRRQGDAPWQRISPAQPLISPSFHDADVQPGRTYVYAVSAIDRDGHESGRSATAQETVPIS